MAYHETPQQSDDRITGEMDALVHNFARCNGQCPDEIKAVMDKAAQAGVVPSDPSEFGQIWAEFSQVKEAEPEAPKVVAIGPAREARRAGGQQQVQESAFHAQMR